MANLKLTGYADPLSVKRSETVRFYVNSEDREYVASIVRLMGPSDLDRDKVVDERVASSIDGSYNGVAQKLIAGSCGIVDGLDLSSARGFTVRVWLRPMYIGEEIQTVLSASNEDGVIYALKVDETGCLVLSVAGSEGTAEIVGDQPLIQGEWYGAVASYDAEVGRAFVHQWLVSGWPSETTCSTAKRMRCGCLNGTDARLTVAAVSKDSRFGEHFDGRIYRPTIFSGPSKIDNMADLIERPGARSSRSDVIGEWDFSLEMDSDLIIDVSGRDSHGRLHQVPARAVKGPFYSYRELDWRQAPDDYGAIHFHSDDMQDAGWVETHAWEVPRDLPSGVYALKLEIEGRVDWVPFFVVPSTRDEAKPKAKIAVLYSTFNYLAYTHFHSIPRFIMTNHMPWLPFDIKWNFDHDLYIDEQQQEAFDHLEMGGGFYDRHRDLSAVMYSSTRRPLLNWRPDVKFCHTNAPQHLAEDIYLELWLRHEGLEHDALTEHVLHEEGSDLLRCYDTLIIPSHPEYWSDQLLTTLHDFQFQGGNVMLLGANEFSWVTSVDKNRPWLVECRKGLSPMYGVEQAELHHSTTGEPGADWTLRARSPGLACGMDICALGWPESKAANYNRLPESYESEFSFVFDGVDQSKFGDFGYGQNSAAGHEISSVFSGAGYGRPVRIARLATSQGTHARSMRGTHYAYMAEDNPVEGNRSPLVGADIAMFESPNGGRTFHVGSIHWLNSIAWNDFDNDIARITGNVLRAFLDEGGARESSL